MCWAVLIRAMEGMPIRIIVSRHICGGILTPTLINTGFILLLFFDDCQKQNESKIHPAILLESRTEPHLAPLMH